MEGLKDVREFFEELEAVRKLEDKRCASSVFWRLYYKIRNVFRWFCRIDLKYELKKVYWFFQRGSRGWADCDVWNADFHIASVIFGCLRGLRKNKRGISSVYCSSDVVDGEKKWNAVLDHMIWTFELSKKVIEGDAILWNFEISDEDNLVYRNTLKKVWSNTRLLDVMFLSKDETKKFYEGFDLFKENFFSFWD